jgi:hypothetical protein
MKLKKNAKRIKNRIFCRNLILSFANIIKNPMSAVPKSNEKQKNLPKTYNNQ